MYFGSNLDSFPLGLSISTSTRVGNALGANLAQKARLISMVAYLITAGIAVFNSITLFIGRNMFGLLFSSDPEVVQLVSEVVSLAVWFQLVDGIAGVGGGILRGSGRQKFGAWINLGGYYVLGLPLGVIAAFKLDFGLSGLWAGLTFSLLFCASCIMFIVMKTDWELQAERALRLVQQQEI